MRDWVYFDVAIGGLTSGSLKMVDSTYENNKRHFNMRNTRAEMLSETDAVKVFERVGQG